MNRPIGNKPAPSSKRDGNAWEDTASRTGPGLQLKRPETATLSPGLSD